MEAGSTERCVGRVATHAIRCARNTVGQVISCAGNKSISRIADTTRSRVEFRTAPTTLITLSKNRFSIGIKHKDLSIVVIKHGADSSIGARFAIRRTGLTLIIKSNIVAIHAFDALGWISSKT